ncbi:MAG: GTPase Era [Candidatus Omnitrophota bacterium]
MSDIRPFRSGYAAIIGKTNVGKSSILNALVGEKVAIVTRKPETTRDRILGILTRPDAQVVFVDTPGIHKPRNLLGKSMTRTAKEALDEVDTVVFVIDAKGGIGHVEAIIFDLLKKCPVPIILAINKADLVKKPKLLPLIDQASKLCGFKEIIPTSVVNGDNMDVLLEKIIENLPEGPKYFPSDQLTDKNARFMAAELIREKVLFAMRQEIPHSVAVVIEEFKEREEKKKNYYIRALIYVEKVSQKKIVIGKKGQMLKTIGSNARKDIERFLRRSVFLELWVKVCENWRNDAAMLRQMRQE